MEPSKEINDLSYAIIGAALKIHKEIGPGLYESAYEELLVYELKQMDLQVKRQLPVSLIYHDLNIPDSYRLDLLIEDKIIIELKAVRTLDDIHYKQLLTYLRLMKKELGLLINFNETILKNGIKRVINQKWT
jgi:GxxExxY protein